MSQPKRTRALLAIAFASGMLNPQLPAMADSQSESTKTMIQQITNNTKLAPELQAFYLLKLASLYLADGDTVQADRTIKSLISVSPTDWERQQSKIENVLAEWAQELYASEQLISQATIKEQRAKPQLKPDEATQLADASLQEAVWQLSLCRDKLAEEHMYFIASRLFRKVGNFDMEQDCKDIRNNSFERDHPQVSEGEVKVKSAILNAEAFRILPVVLPDKMPPGFRWEPTTPQEVFTEAEFKESEKLKLQAIALADQLSFLDHFRRKAHRDMALWYLHFGKMELAEKEKQTLFGLTGIHMDSVLFPYSGACGQVTWWDQRKSFNGCGMG